MQEFAFKFFHWLVSSRGRGLLKIGQQQQLHTTYSIWTAVEGSNMIQMMGFYDAIQKICSKLLLRKCVSGRGRGRAGYNLLAKWHQV